MTQDEARAIISNSDGDVYQIGCTDKAVLFVCFHLCKRHRRMLYTYTITDADINNADPYIGKHHVVRPYESISTLTEDMTIIYNTKQNDQD